MRRALAGLVASTVILLQPIVIGAPAGASIGLTFDGGPGVGPPPSTLGPYDMLRFPADRSPDGATTFRIPTPVQGDLGVGAAVHRIVPTSWPTWSHGYQGDVYSTANNSMSLHPPANTPAFYFYAQPISPAYMSVSAGRNDGSSISSGPVWVDSNGGAKYFGFYTTGSDRATSFSIESTVPFAVGDFGIAATCEGFPATVVGSPEADLLIGTVGSDVILAGDGNDTVLGAAGDDIICLGNGRDRADGDGGNDSINGEGGNDRLFGGDGGDQIRGGPGQDEMYGGDGNDFITGGGGIDFADGGNGDDAINVISLGGTMTAGFFVLGGPGRDSIGVAGGGYADGGPDDDVMGGSANRGSIALHGGDGNDELHVGSHDHVQLTYGDAGDDLIFGRGQNSGDQVFGGDGNDTMIGRGGSDVMYGEAGDDHLVGQGGADWLSGGSGFDILEGGPANDTLDCGDDSDWADGGADIDTSVGCETAIRVP